MGTEVGVSVYSWNQVVKCTEQCIDIDKSIEWLACQGPARALNVQLEIERLDTL